MTWGERSGIPLRILCWRRLGKRVCSGRAWIIGKLDSMHNVWTTPHLRGPRSRAYLLERCQKSANEKARLISNTLPATATSKSTMKSLMISSFQRQTPLGQRSSKNTTTQYLLTKWMPFMGILTRHTRHHLNQARGASWISPDVSQQCL